MKIKKTVFPLLLVPFYIFSSCGTLNSKIKINELSVIMSEAPSALDVVLQSLEKADIVFIGSASHQLLNEKLFLNSSLALLYNAGVRYILGEGGSDDGPVYSDELLLEKEVFLLYPWEHAGIRYGTSDLSKEVFLFNQNKQVQNQIKYIGLEAGREDFISENSSLVDLTNYRDKYMAETAFGFIDNITLGEKVLVVGGGAHGSTELIPNAFGSSTTFKPLGVYLAEKYSDKYFSLYYITLDEMIKIDENYKDMLDSKTWQNIPNEPKYISPKKAAILNTLLPILYSSGFDGYIVDKTAIQGIFYSYAFFDHDVLKEVIEQTKQYNTDISLAANEHRLDYDDPDIYYTIHDLIKNIYYLKLNFGDNFPYDFWNPKIPLKEALSTFEEAVFSAGVNHIDKVAFPSPSMEALRDYHSYMFYFNSLNENSFWDSSIHSKFEKQIAIVGPYIKKVHELFPYELWADYWYAKMYIKSARYEKAYKYLQKMMSNSLSCSMEIYPEIIELAISCADRLGCNKQANEYRIQRELLWNEYSIDTSHFVLFDN